jgi:phosphatidylserine decarboxylase
MNRKHLTRLCSSLLLAAGLAVTHPAAADQSGKLAEPEAQKIYQTLRAFNDSLAGDQRLDDKALENIAVSPCRNSLFYLVSQYQTDPKVPKALDKVVAGLQPLPVAYQQENPWKSKNGGELLAKILKTFPGWCTELPKIRGSYDNGLANIQRFSWFYYHNPAGQDFVQGRNPNNPSEILETGRKFTKDFTLEYGKFMDGPESTGTIPEWIADPIIEIQDYQKQKASDYKYWNQFFARELIVDTKNQTIPSRPVTMPDRDYVVVAPTDCIMNSLVQVIKENGDASSRKLLDNPLQENTVLDVKGIPLSLSELLSGVEDKYRQEFVGGTGQSCVLMPNTYHHFHAPVDGTIVHASIIKDNTFGYYDWPNWVPTSGNVGRPGTDFSQYRAYQRGVIVIELKYKNLDGVISTGYVAVIPVGLETIGSLVYNKDIKPGTKVKKGYTELGNFFYGGSLNILLYSKNLAGSSVQVRMGNQINVLNLGSPLPSK